MDSATRSPGDGDERARGPVRDHTAGGTAWDGSNQAQPLCAQWRPRYADSGVPEREATARGLRRVRSALRNLVARYGWRIYALPVLVALTVLVAVQTVTGPDSTTVAESAADSGNVGSGGQGSQPLVTEDRPDPVSPDVPAAELPAGGDFTRSGEGTWHVVPGTSDVAGHSDKVLTYTVEVEDGTDSSSYAGDKTFAKTVENILSDPRGWIGSGEVSFKRVDGDAPNPDFRLSLTTPKTNHKPGVCGYAIEYEASCYNSSLNRVVINLARWERGAIAFDGDLGLYRQYAINHEVGHALGNNHAPCGKDGALAPVMMQQTFGVANDYVAKLNKAATGGSGPVPADGKVCRPSAWPNPTPGPAE